MNSKWEYKILRWGDDEEYLNQLGNEGWELVSVTHRPSYIPTLYFKREVYRKFNPPL